MDAAVGRPVHAIGTPSYSNLTILFAGSMLLSAALLFGVQPMFARMSLPLLGGSTSVWAIAMCFFQAALLLGYAYAHISNRFLSPSGAIITHVALIYSAFNFLPIAAPEALESTGGVGSGLQLIWAFTKAIGVPFVVLSATAPLLQSWFLRARGERAPNPYMLYAASNIGSLGALLAYPFFVEPLSGLEAQANAWHWGFLLLALCIIACGYAQLEVGDHIKSNPVATPVSARARATWIFLSFITSGLLVAWTNRITTDIASAPFLWLPPLALYLLTFIVAFRDEPPIAPEKARFFQLVFLPMAYLAPTLYGGSVFFGLLIASTITFFITLLICHRILYETRPDPSHLTEFYLLMSLGGVLGGAFVSLLAPIVFTSTSEFPILLTLGVLAASNLINAQSAESIYDRRYLMFCAVAAILAGYGLAQTAFRYESVSFLQILALSLAAIFLFGAGRIAASIVVVHRNYYGLLSISDTELPGYRIFSHGTTIHGAQHMLDIDPLNKGRPLTMTYYTENGGIGRSLRATQDALRLAGRAGQYAIVGLGVGSVACFRESDDAMIFFEVDPDVTAIARNPDYFTYMSKCAPNAAVINGDARISLKSVAKQSYDYMLIDAFSSDTIPAHLLTREAFQLYLSRLKDDGMLALHLSNRFMDLAPVVQATVQSMGEPLHMRLVNHRPLAGDRGALPSLVIVISRSSSRITFLPDADDTLTLHPSDELPAPWTDDYANIPAAILRSLMMQ
jgi:hypothetical protein